MRYVKQLICAGVLVAANALVGPASAVPMTSISAQSNQAAPIENVHLICDRYGRCYNSRRYVRRYYAAPRYSYGPSYDYGPSYGYGYGGPSYGYGYGGPSISLGFGGFGHHHHHW